MAKDTTEITVKILHESEHDILVTDGDVQEWLPKSQIEKIHQTGTTETITLPTWLAQYKNLI